MSRILSVVLLITTTLSAQDDRPDRRVKDSALQKAINEGIHLGIQHLFAVQNKDGSWTYDKDGGPMRRRTPDGEPRLDGTGGLTALALYALAAADVPADHKAIERGLKWIEDHPHPFGDESEYGVYSASLLVLALTRIDSKQYRRRIAKLATSIHEAQLKSGQWSYGLATKRTSTNDDDQRGPRMGRRPTNLGDNSNTQFAVLALWSAQELTRYRVPKKTWKRVQALFEGSQQKDGGWTYKVPRTTTSEPEGRGRRRRRGADRSSTVTPTMTAAGLVSYVLATAAIKGGSKALPKVRREKPATRGLSNFLAQPMDRAYRNYYLVYSIERVGTVLGVPDFTWYPQGAKALLDQQDSKGSFRGSARAVGQGDSRQAYNTSLALLFLSKATLHPITQSTHGRK